MRVRPATVAAACLSLACGIPCHAQESAPAAALETAYQTDPARRAEAEAMYRGATGNVLGGFTAETAEASELRMLESAYLGFPQAVFGQCMSESNDYGRNADGDLPRGLAWCQVSVQLAPGQYGKFAEKQVRKLRGKLNPQDLARADAELQRIHAEIRTRLVAPD
jgi:hypothetical protein